MEETLRQLGLTEPQVKAYVLLLEQNELTPPKLAKDLSLTRSNAYKVLDRLVELGLASREKSKKYIYRLEDPIALTNLLAHERNRLLALEQGVKASVQSLRTRYQQQSTTLETKAYQGSAKLKQLYETQAEMSTPIHLLAARSGNYSLGFETLDALRKLSAQHGQQRFGITADTAGAPANPDVDKRSNLTRTWIDASEYTAPVEWSVCGDEVRIFIFEKHGSAVRIKNQAIAESMRQIWHIMDKHLRRDPEYASLPRKARRTV